MGKNLSRSHSWVGGANVGGRMSFYGSAELEATEKRIVLRLGDYSEYYFEPADVLGFEPCEFLDVPTTGIRIQHMRSKYPKDVLFQTAHRNVPLIISQLISLGYGSPIADAGPNSRAASGKIEPPRLQASA